MANKKAKAKAKPVAKKVTKPVKKVSKPAPKSKVKPVAKKSAKAKPIAKPLAKKVAKPAVKKATKPVAKKALKPIAKKVIKPVAKKVSKPIVKKPAAKPVAKKIVPVAKPAKAAALVVSKPLAKAVTKPVVVKENKPSSIPLKKKAEKFTNGNIARDINPTITNLPKQQPMQSKAGTLPPTQYNSDGSEKIRYTDAELNEFKNLIVKKIEDAKQEYVLQQQQINSANEHGTDDTASTFKMLEDGSETLAKEEAAQLAARQRKFIEQLENALLRIENKTYGICRVTGKLIPKERLRAVPHTTQSIEAKLMQYKDQ